MVASLFGRCLEIRVEVRPGHDVKKPALMASMKVLGTGENNAACRKVATSRSVFVRRHYCSGGEQIGQLEAGCEVYWTLYPVVKL